MKIEEFKLRLMTAVNDLVDVYFGENDFMDSMVNSTLKVMVKLNENKIDTGIRMFADSNGEIDADTIINAYADNMKGEGVNFNLKDFVKDDFIRSLLPDKTLIISKDDILKIIKEGGTNHAPIHQF